MQFPLLAVPCTADRPVDAFTFSDAPGCSSDRVRGFCESHLLPISEGRARVESSELKRPYLDPCLRGDTRCYAQFVVLLLRAGVVEVTASAGESEVGAFAVHKKRMDSND